MSLSSYDTLCCPIGDKTIPGNGCEIGMLRTNPRRTNLRPEHFFGSHWQRSYIVKKRNNTTVYVTTKTLYSTVITQ